MSKRSMSAYRWAVASRVLAAALGGYALASALTVLLALTLPLPRSQAVSAATMLSFILYALAVIWVFSVRSVTRAWLGMLVPSVLIAAGCLVLRAGGAP